MNKFTFKEWCQLAMPQSGLPLEETRQLARKMYLGLDRFIEVEYLSNCLGRSQSREEENTLDLETM